jgi:hypothetical protein
VEKVTKHESIGGDMKKFYTLIFALMVMPLVLSAQYTIGSDAASNYTVENYTGEGNFGYGFGTWTSAVDNGGRFLGTATNNGASNSGILNTGGNAFGMWGGTFSDVGRNFPSLTNGSKLTFSLSFQWDNGNKGVSLYTNGVNNTEVFNFNIAAAGYTWSGSGSQAMTNWNVAPGDRQNGVVISFEFTQTAEGLDYQITAAAGDGGFGTKTGSIEYSGSINALKFYVSGAGGDGGNFYFNNLKIERNTAQVDIDGIAGWRMLSVPTAGVSISNLASQNLIQGVSGGTYEGQAANIYTSYNGTSFQTPANMSTELSLGKGFIWYMYNNENVAESKLLENFVFSVSGTEPSGDVTGVAIHADGDKFNLMGNPFPNPLNVSNIQAVGGEFASAVVQVWDPSTSSGGGGTSSYVLSNSGTLGGKIAPMQGFVLENNDATSVTFQATGKTNGGTFLKEVVQNPRSIEFVLEGQNTIDKAAILYFHPESSDDWDLYDATKILPLTSEYAIMALGGIKNGESVLQAQRSFNIELAGDLEIPVHVNSTNARELTLSWPVLNNVPSEWSITLIDNETGVEVDLKTQSSYTFNQVANAVQKAKPNPTAMTLDANASERFTLKISDASTTNAPFMSDSPSAISLSQNYPNPFNPSTSVRFALPEAGFVSLSVYDVTGRLIASIANGEFGVGEHTVSFDASALSSGVYVYRLNAGGQTLTRKMTLMK